MNSIKQSTDAIFELYTKWGSSDYIGESITQTEHALQCAMVATEDARLNVYDDYIRKCVIISALLHDIGHLVGMDHGYMEMRGGDDIFSNASLGIVGHEGIGSAYLKDCGMPSLVCELVDSHVMAKRYLCTVRDDYYNKLSDASKATMQLQGGFMNDDELRKFRSSRMSELKVYLREYDDGGKEFETCVKKDKKIIHGLETYRNIIESVLLSGRLFA
jgi:predicted HD phosphohydrolase